MGYRLEVRPLPAKNGEWRSDGDGGGDEWSDGVGGPSAETEPHSLGPAVDAGWNTSAE